MSSFKSGSLILGFLLAVTLVTLYYTMNPRTISVSINDMMSNRMNKPTERVVQKYKQQVASRKNFMENTDSDFARIYNNLAPEVYCNEELKVGTTDDGGKWMCSPYNLPEDCVIFSLGLHNSISFEEDIQEMTNQRCRVVGVDMGEQLPETKKRLHSIRANSTKAKVSVTTDVAKEEYSLDDIMKMHNVKEIEILKIDIEGSELKVMPEFLKTHRVSQIMIEVHGTPKETLAFLKMVASHGYYLFHYEINGAWHQLCEYAFIHESVIDKYDATIMARYLA